MKQEEKNKVIQEIEALGVDEDFVPAKGLPIPLRDAVIILPWMQGDRKTASGIILTSAASDANSKKIGYIARIGPTVNLGFDVEIGMRVWFENKANHFQIDASDGNTYIMVPQHYVYCIWTPDSYEIPHFKDKSEKRRDARREGLANVAKDEIAKLQEDGVEINDPNLKK